jgi:hypothetical protein
VIETAWQRGARVRCVWLTTDVPNAQINAIRRMLDVHGRLPTPEEIRRLSKQDTRYLLPDAQFRYERSFEPPTLEEGFASVDAHAFVREPEPNDGRSLILDFDAVAESVRAPETLARYRGEGWLIFVHAWRPRATTPEVEATFARMRELLGEDVDVACCPHDAGPPVCWCRKPIPGSVLEFAVRRRVALERSIVVGTSVADRTMAERIGARFEASSAFFG